MRIDFKTRSMLVLAITAVLCSRAMFAFFDDPEGPNLLVVIGMAAFLFLVSSVPYLSGVCPSLTGYKRSAAAIVIQVLVATGLYLGLR